ncbi:CHAT domain-containing protein [soil metagenome]
MKYILPLLFLYGYGWNCQAGNANFPPEVTHPLLEKAGSLFDQGAYDSAYFIYTQAANEFREKSDDLKYVMALTGKAHASIGLQKFTETKFILDSALVTGRKELGEHSELSQVYYMYGVYYMYIKEGEKALKMHEKALEIRLNLFGKEHLKIAESYNGIGEVYRYAIENYFQAEEFFQRTVDILHTLTNFNKKILFRAYYNLATTNRLIYDYDKALLYGLKSEELLGSLEESNSTWLISCYNMLANIYNSKNQPQQAIKYYQKGIDMRLSGEPHLNRDVASGYNNLGIAYIETENYQEAINSTEKALNLLMDAIPFDTAKIIHSHLIQGISYTKSNHFAQARNSFQKCLQILQNFSGNNDMEISNTYLQLSRLKKQEGNYDSALYFVQQAILLNYNDLQINGQDFNPDYRLLKDKPHLYEHLKEKGTILIALAQSGTDNKKWKEALNSILLSISLMDVYWESQEGELSRLSFMKNNYSVYEMGLECTFYLYNDTSDKFYIKTAFNLMERGKSRLLRERVAEIQNFNNRKIPDSLLLQERHLKSQFAALQSNLEMTGQNLTEDTLRDQLFSIGEELRNWQKKIKNNYPEYTSFPGQQNGMALDDLQNKLKERSVFVEYFFGTEAVYIISASSKTESFIKSKPDSLNSKISEFSQLIVKSININSLEEDYRSFTRLGHELYRQLLYAPLDAVSPEGEDSIWEELLLVPDGILNFLPFHALISTMPSERHSVDYKNLNYTALQYAISYAYDADSHFATPYEEHENQFGLLAFGWSDGSSIGKIEDEISGTYTELNSLASIMPGKFFRGELAKKITFMEHASAYNILHLAIHGGADEQNIHKSFLQFSDEKLFHHEVYQLNIQANLTVLSACETGNGKIFSSEGAYSMAHGFSYAGAKSILMTLWKVNDQTTASLVQKFYQNLKNEEPLNNALKNAQKEYLQNADEYSAHPVYWAGFSLWGNHLAIQKNNDLNILMPVIMGFGIFFIILLLLKIISYKSIKLPTASKKD